MHEMVGTDPLPVRGRVRVELFDDRTGRLVERVDGENFVTTDHKAVMRWWQRMAFGAFSPGTPVADGNGVLPYHLPRMTNEHLAYWTDDAAEDPANEHRVNGEVIGWASRWPVGSPTGRRGVIDVGASVNGPDYSTWVFNWTSSQGVGGPFQSVGWTRLVEASAMPIPRFPDPDMADIEFTPVLSATTENVPGSGYGTAWWDSTAEKWVTFSGDSTTTNSYCIALYPADGGTRSSFIDTGITETLNAVCRIGTDFIITGAQQNPHGRLYRRTNAMATVWNATIAGTGHVYYGVDVDAAGKIWTAGSDGLMRRHNPTNGSIEVSVTPWRTPSELRGIAYDRTADRFWIAGMWSGVYGIARVASDGTLDGPTFGMATEQTVTATSPFSQYRVPGLATFDPWWMARGVSAAVTTTGIGLPSPALNTKFTVGAIATTSTRGKWGGGIAWKDGTLYALENGTHTFNARRVGCHAARLVSGHNIATRVRLSSPVTKSSAQNLRITYRFDFT